MIRIVVIVLAIISLHGGILRLYDISEQDFWLDEAISVVHALGITEHGYPLLNNGRVSWDSAPVHYLMALGLLLPVPLDLHLVSRIISVVLGTLSIPLAYALGRQMSGSRNHAWLCVFFMSYLTYHIAWSRQARLYPYLIFFMLAGLLFTLRYASKKYLHELIPAGLFCLLAALTHRSGYISLFVLVLTAIPILGTRSIRLHHPRGLKIRLAKVFFCGALLLAALLMIPSHSNILDAIPRITALSGMNYTKLYSSFLYDQLGIIFPLTFWGCIMAIRHFPGKSIPLIISASLYFFIIAFIWPYYANRYSYPLWPVMVMFATFPVAKLLENTQWIVRAGGVLVITASIYSAQLTWFPQTYYHLGRTEPQPPWRSAFEYIQNDCNSHIEPLTNAGNKQDVVTISALPLFHDIYLGPNVGTKYYLPVNYTGFPGEDAHVDAFTSAITISGLDKLKSTSGYLVLDDFSLSRLHDTQIKEWISTQKPVFASKRDYAVYVWKLMAKRS